MEARRLSEEIETSAEAAGRRLVGNARSITVAYRFVHDVYEIP